MVAPVYTPEELAEKFINEMLEETGCSIRFLNEAKPILIKLFRDTEGTALETCLVSVKQTISSQANIEQQSSTITTTTRPSVATLRSEREELIASVL